MRGPGFFSNAFKFFDFSYAAETLGDLGYRGVELWCKGQFFVPGRDGAGRVEEMRDAAGDMDFYALSAHLDFISPNDDLREASVKRFERVIDATELFGVDRVVTASGYLHGREPNDRMGRRLEECMERVADRAEERDVRVILEPEPEKYLRAPGETVDLIEELGPDRFGACADLSHAIALDQSARGFMEDLGPHLEHVHLDDGRFGVHPHRHYLPGDGDVDYAEAFDYLEEQNFDGWVSVELNEHTEDPKRAAASTMEFMEESGLIERFD